MTQVDALAVFDDGGGPALYAAGRFTTAGGVAANNIARWNGSSWSPLGSGTDSVVTALTVFDDGSGLALYAGGYFTTAGGVAASYVAKWNGASWSPLGSGVGADGVSALAVFDDGTGPALYAGGGFTTAGGVAANFIAKWNGSNWSPLGSGIGGGGVTPVYALTAFDDGTGPALYAGGYFSTAGGAAASHIAKWNGSSWSPLGIGVGPGLSVVAALAVFDNGSGRALYVGGRFMTAGGVATHAIAKWDGSIWSPLAGGLSVMSGSNDPNVNALAVFDDGNGPALCAGGEFAGAGRVAANDIARWRGSSWSALGSGMNGGVGALTAFDDGTGPALYAGGSFTGAGGVAANCVAKWNGSSWSALASGMSWVNGGLEVSVHALTVFDDGGGPALYAGGEFTAAGGVAANYIARWDGSSWSPLGSGIGFPMSNPSVSALTTFDDGGGLALYAAGAFATAGGVAANSIAKWNGSSWSPLGSGMNYSASALTVFDDGTGPALYAGGFFTIAGGVAANRIAKWNGLSWSPLGSGMSGGASSPSVTALTVFNDGGGPALYAGGGFTIAGGVAASRIAKWNGSSWSALGSGMSGMTGLVPAFVYALTLFDDGGGASLYAGGNFTNAGSAFANCIAKWNGSSWSALGSGMSGTGGGLGAFVQALTGFDSGDGAALYAGGLFEASPAGDSYLAKWGNPTGCGTPGSSTCEPGTSGVIACPCNNAPSTSGVGCNNSSNTGGSQLAATGIARLRYDTVVFTTSGEKPTATSVVLQGNSASSTGVTFGQGVRCVAGTLKRLYMKTASGGSITAPQGTDLRVHARSAALGDTIAPGTHRYYGVYYRDPIVLGGCPAVSTFNITQQLDVLWGA
jgi:hypothetical protein